MRTSWLAFCARAWPMRALSRGATRWCATCIGRLLSPKWFRTEATLAHARFYFDDFDPDEGIAAPARIMVARGVVTFFQWPPCRRLIRISRWAAEPAKNFSKLGGEWASSPKPTKLKELAFQLCGKKRRLPRTCQT